MTQNKTLNMFTTSSNPYPVVSAFYSNAKGISNSKRLYLYYVKYTFFDFQDFTPIHKTLVRPLSTTCGQKTNVFSFKGFPLFRVLSDAIAVCNRLSSLNPPTWENTFVGTKTTCECTVKTLRNFTRHIRFHYPITRSNGVFLSS